MIASKQIIDAIVRLMNGRESYHAPASQFAHDLAKINPTFAKRTPARLVTESQIEIPALLRRPTRLKFSADATGRYVEITRPDLGGFGQEAEGKEVA